MTAVTVKMGVRFPSFCCSELNLLVNNKLNSTHIDAALISISNGSIFQPFLFLGGTRHTNDRKKTTIYVTNCFLIMLR